jgi:hypothetical protein
MGPATYSYMQLHTHADMLTIVHMLDQPRWKFAARASDYMVSIPVPNSCFMQVLLAKPLHVTGRISRIFSLYPQH